MTQNQLRFLQLQEDQRANRVKEAETERSNRTKESETNRANLENERMAREKWDYEKYGGGKGGSVGSTIRTIKAAINDVAKLGTAVGNAIDAAEKNPVADYVPGIQGFDARQFSNDKNKEDLSKSLGVTGTIKSSKDKSSYTTGNVTDLLKQADSLKKKQSSKDAQPVNKKVYEKGKKKMGKLLGIDDE